MPGDIFAVAKLKHTETGDTLTDPKNPIVARWPGRVFERRLERLVDAICAGRFAESNRRTQELTGLPHSHRQVAG